MKAYGPTLQSRKKKTERLEESILNEAVKNNRMESTGKRPKE